MKNNSFVLKIRENEFFVSIKEDDRHEKTVVS